MEFHTFREDIKNLNMKLTPSMEDYLEMIYRLSLKDGYTRIYELSKSLNIQPPSATKMVQKLSKLNLLKYERYGIITLKEKGKKLGEILLNRHNIIESFLTILGVNKNEIFHDTEIIEHTISNETLRCINMFILYMDKNPNIISDFNKFKDEF